jgi:hypothetical protein
VLNPVTTSPAKQLTLLLLPPPTLLLLLYMQASWTLPP